MIDPQYVFGAAAQLPVAGLTPRAETILTRTQKWLGRIDTRRKGKVFPFTMSHCCATLTEKAIYVLSRVCAYVVLVGEVNGKQFACFQREI